jgi:hypothetical protein
MGGHISTAIQEIGIKTTIEISDQLLREARDLAVRERVTLRSLVERGLHQVVVDSKRQAPFKLRRASFKGAGRRDELREAAWDQLRDLVYSGRGA